MNTLEALTEAERALDEAGDRHSIAQQRLVQTTIDFQKALLAHSAAHNEHQITMRAAAE